MHIIDNFELILSNIEKSNKKDISPILFLTFNEEDLFGNCNDVWSELKVDLIWHSDGLLVSGITKDNKKVLFPIPTNDEPSQSTIAKLIDQHKGLHLARIDNNGSVLNKIAFRLK